LRFSGAAGERFLIKGSQTGAPTLHTLALLIRPAGEVAVERHGPSLARFFDGGPTHLFKKMDEIPIISFTIWI